MKFRCAAQTWTCSRLTALLRKEFDYGSWMSVKGVGGLLVESLGTGELVINFRTAETAFGR